MLANACHSIIRWKRNSLSYYHSHTPSVSEGSKEISDESTPNSKIHKNTGSLPGMEEATERLGKGGSMERSHFFTCFLGCGLTEGTFRDCDTQKHVLEQSSHWKPTNPPLIFHPWSWKTTTSESHQSFQSQDCCLVSPLNSSWHWASHSTPWVSVPSAIKQGWQKDNEE